MGLDIKKLKKIPGCPGIINSKIYANFMVMHN